MGYGGRKFDGGGRPVVVRVAEALYCDNPQI